MLFFSSVNLYASSSLLFKIVEVVVENNVGLVPIHFNNQEEGTDGHIILILHFRSLTLNFYQLLS